MAGPGRRLELRLRDVRVKSRRWHLKKGCAAGITASGYQIVSTEESRDVTSWRSILAAMGAKWHGMCSIRAQGVSRMIN